MTAEQVCRALNERTAAWLRRHRGRSDARQTLETIRYHQTRNAAARNSRLRHREQRTRRLFAL